MAKPQTTQQQPVSADPFAPIDIARRLEAANVARADLPVRSLLLLGLVGGVYISFGGALATLVLTDNTLGYGLGRLAAGLAFSLGLIMLVVAGGELFTGNNLMVLALAGRKISVRAMLRNWGIVYVANAAGAVLLALAIHYSGILDGNGVKATAIKIAEAKARLDVPTAFLRGVLCNMLVCLAVWLSTAARSVEGKVVAIAFPISAFVALGFEHCVANFYLLGIGMLSGADIKALEFLANIGSVTVGNTLGGVLLAAILFLIYLSKDRVQRTFSRPVAVTPSSDTAAMSAAAAETVKPPAQPAPVEEPMRQAAVRIRLKAEHGRPVASPPEREPPRKDPVVTRLVWGSRRDGRGGT
jgi:formate/nitrite transporter